MEDLGQKAAIAVLGIALGWAGNALTLQGRVAAIEAGQARIEAQVATLITTLGGGGRQEAAR